MNLGFFSVKKFFESSLDEELHIGLFTVTNEGCNTAVFDKVKELFFFDAHQVHTHGTGHELDTQLVGLLNHIWQGIHILLLHDVLDHGWTHTTHIHIGKRQLFG